MSFSFYQYYAHKLSYLCVPVGLTGLLERAEFISFNLAKF